MTITAADIRHLRTAARDYEKTEELKRRMAQLREQRTTFYLLSADLEPIFRWKLERQHGRTKAHFARNTESAYRSITQAAFAINESDPSYEAELRLGVLTSLRGVGVPVASAILAIAEPCRYCVIDFRGWRAVFDEDRRSFEPRDYIRYLDALRPVSADLGWPIQEVDLAIWALDVEQDERRNQET
jgi:hypothetical protein